MEFFQEAVNMLKTIVCMLGGAVAIVGMINFAQGQSAQNGAQKAEGLGQFMGGGAIFLIGLKLVPSLINFIK